MLQPFKGDLNISYIFVMLFSFKTKLLMPNKRFAPFHSKKNKMALLSALSKLNSVCLLYVPQSLGIPVPGGNVEGAGEAGQSLSQWNVFCLFVCFPRCVFGCINTVLPCAVAPLCLTPISVMQSCRAACTCTPAGCYKCWG